MQKDIDIIISLLGLTTDAELTNQMQQNMTHASHTIKTKLMQVISMLDNIMAMQCWTQ